MDFALNEERKMLQSAIKEFAAKQAASKILPLAGKMSDKDLGLLLWLTRRLAPTDYTRSFLESIEQMNQEQHPIIQMIRRMIRQTSPYVRERLVNNLLIKELMQGNVIREQLRLQGLAAPQVFLISPTMRCNLRCSGCYASSYSKKDDLKFEVIDRIIAEGKELGMFWITILGGEPFVRRDFLDLLEVFVANREHFSFAILTNGSFIDATLARRLRKLHPAFVQVSIEGSRATHDKIRGRGDFDQTVSAVKHLVRKRIRTLISFSAHTGHSFRYNSSNSGPVTPKKLLKRCGFLLISLYVIMGCPASQSSLGAV